MEADAILKMVKYAFHHCCFIIGVILSDNYRIMKAMLKYPSRGALGKGIR